MKHFSKIEELLLEALRAAVHGEAVQWEALSPEEWDGLMQLANAQKLLPPVFQATYSFPAAKAWSEAEQVKRACRLQVASQALRTERFLTLYDRLNAAGVRPLVVKGILCRALYPNGELRQSADEDLCALPGEFQRCCSLLRDFGMTCAPNADETADCEIGWRQDVLYIELHRQLFPPDSEALRGLEEPFAASFAHPQEYEVRPGCVVLSLNAHDHLLYLLLHAYKHFIHSGFGVRQVCDIGLWAREYAEQIDWTRLLVQTHRLRADRFSAAVFRIAREYFAIDVPTDPNWETVKADCRPMLADLLRAGIYGTAGKSRQHSASVTLHAVESKRGGRKGGVLRTVFPSVSELKRTYPILCGRPLLLPWVWCRRLCRYFVETRTAKHDTVRETLRISRERKKLLKKYDII